MLLSNKKGKFSLHIGLWVNTCECKFFCLIQEKVDEEPNKFKHDARLYIICGEFTTSVTLHYMREFTILL